MATCSKPSVVSSGFWSAGFSQFTIVCWCCSMRRTFASISLSAWFDVMRANACEVRFMCASMPFIKMTRTRVNASSLSLRYGGGASSRQVNF
jgi:hypothetical protein